MSAFNLRTKMSLVISLLMATILTALAFSAQLYFADQIKEMVHSQQFTMLSAIADQIDDKIEATQSEIVDIAATLDTAVFRDQSSLQAFFATRPADLAMFDNGLYVFSAGGRLLFKAPAEPGLLLKDFSGYEYLRRTLATKAPQISAPFISPQTTRHPIIMFTAPVFGPGGEVVAVLAGSIDLTKNNFLGKLATVRLGEHGYLYLYNSARTMIVHRERERICKQDVPPGANQLFDKALGGFEGTGETVNSRGLAVLSSFKRLKTTGWILASNFPLTEAYAPVHRAQHFLMIAPLVVFLVSVLVVWLSTGYLTAPLLSITRQVRELAGKGRGSSQATISAASRDEIGVLAEAFNLLLKELGEQKGELEKQLDFSQRVIDTTPLPIFFKDSQGRYLGCNKAFEDFTGFSSAFILGKTVFDVAPRNLAEVYYQADQELLQSKELQSYESAVQHTDGTQHDVLFFKATFPAADGGVGGMIGAMLDITDLKKARSALEAQKEFAESLVQNTSVPTFVLDGQHRVISWNHACERLTGVEAGELLGSDQLWKVFYEEKHPLLADLVIDGRLDQLADHYESYSCSVLVPDGIHSETWYRDRQGNRRYLTIGAAPIRDGSGELIGAIETIEDITERKEAQDAHEKIRRQLQLILDAAGEGIYGLDLQGKVGFVNPAAAAMLGWEQKELLGRDQHAVMHHSRADGTPFPAEECPIYQAFQEGVPRQGNEVFWRRDGSSFQVEFTSTPIREEGEVVGAVVIFKDITERTEAEEQLLKLSQAVMQSPVSIMITDPAGNIEYVNPRFTQLSGYHAAEVIGRNPRFLKSGRTPEEVYRTLWNTISSGSVWSGEIFNRQKDGETYWEHATISPIRNSAGEISHYMAFMESVTERKKLEEQLRHAQKMEAIGQLAGGVAHDFNNILTAIVGFGHLLQCSIPPEDPKRGHMEQILDAADRATHLTKSLLAFSRKQVMLLQQIELNELVRKHAQFLVRIIGEDITLKTALCPTSLFILADGGQVEQVLMNLATNARDAMPAGGELSIATEMVQLDKEFLQQHGFGAPGHYALVTVSDTGAGMDAKTQEKIFDPFFTTKAPGRGTGLGLSIVYGIVKQHGGYITLASQCGFGTTFSIYLPVVAKEEKVVGHSSGLVPTGGTETVMVVEDDPAVLRLVETVLKRFGYKVLTAGSGEEAVAIFEANWQDIKLALIDVIMPKMNGPQVCELLKLRSPTLKVLFLSGYTADMIADKGILLDSVDILPKPAKPLELARKVRDMLDIP